MYRYQVVKEIVRRHRKTTTCKWFIKKTYMTFAFVLLYDFFFKKMSVFRSLWFYPLCFFCDFFIIQHSWSTRWFVLYKCNNSLFQRYGALKTNAYKSRILCHLFLQTTLLQTNTTKKAEFVHIVLKHIFMFILKLS